MHLQTNITNSRANWPRNCFVAIASLPLVLGFACHRKASPEPGAVASASASESIAISASVSASAPQPTAGETEEVEAQKANNSACPKEMLLISKGKRPYCIDRWEAMLVDKSTGTRLSPYYPVDRKLAAKLESEWNEKRSSMGSTEAQMIPVPPLPAWQKAHDADPMAVSKPGEVPNGYMSGKVAKVACENAGKRLCDPDEWVRACRGTKDRQYPYGDSYQQGTCNVFRASHPAAILHDNASIGHLDPRLNLVSDKDGPLLRRTGQTKSCPSVWGDEALWDMVGNLDEWVDDPDGMFLGGFFARSKRDGCASVVKAHPNSYFDYSLGVRCCKDP
jgi:formylglycine-generating enzyme required for sulfatase activity